jgi:hypothetical protein
MLILDPSCLLFIGAKTVSYESCESNQTSSSPLIHIYVEFSGLWDYETKWGICYASPAF